MNRPNDLLTLFSERLRGILPEQEIRAQAAWVLEDVSEQPFYRLMGDLDFTFSRSQLDRLDQILNRLAKGEPLQYILGYAWHHGRRFRVRPGVLIPRQETEELSEWIIRDQHDQARPASGPVRILDVGCGSGIIAVTLALSLPEAQVVAMDKYQVPLEVTQENARLLGARVELVRADVGSQTLPFQSGSFDVVVSNPPYVTSAQKKEMAEQVLSYEPEEALFVPDHDPLVFYRHILDLAVQVLAPDGRLYLEINALLGGETLSLVRQYFDRAELRHDLHGKHRMIKAYGR